MRFAQLLFGPRAGLFGAGLFGAYAAHRMASRAQRSAWKAERAAWKAQRRALRLQRPFIVRVFSALWSLAWLALCFWLVFGYAFGGVEFRYDVEQAVRATARFAETVIELIAISIRGLLAGRGGAQ